MMGDNIRTDAIELMVTKEDFIELMDDNARLLDENKSLRAVYEAVLAFQNEPESTASYELLHNELDEAIAAVQKGKICQ